MIRKIKARFTRGVFTPLEKVELPENEELEITIEEKVAKAEITGEKDPLDITFGAWADIDCETLKKNIYNDREISTRPEVEL